MKILKLRTRIALAVLAWLALVPPGLAYQILGDDICVVATSASQFEDEIERARKGELAQSNSTIVNPRKNLPPIKEKYSAQISLPQDENGNAYVAAVALVSDDGCDVSVNGKQWLKESGKGHDISKGLRRYGKLLLPEDVNQFDITYSQTFYDPAVLENDLDGLSLVVLPIPIDISVKDASGKMNDRILIKKGETIEVALHPMFWEHNLPGNDRIEWYLEQMTSTGGFIIRKLDETGAKISVRMNDSGIFRIYAVINGTQHYYRRHEDVPYHAELPGLKCGDFDYVGVCDSKFQRQMLASAYKYCSEKSTKFALTSSIDLTPYGGIQPWHDYENAWKCNIFVFVVSYEANAKIKMEPRGRIFYKYSSPPTVKEWDTPSYVVDTTPKPNWEYSKPGYPYPGMVMTSEGHMGILDYDGFWITAGEMSVSKCVQLGTSFYTPKTFRDRK